MDSPIAIVGMGIRLPGGCNDSASFWDLLVNKKDAKRVIPPERFNIGGFHTLEAKGPGTLSVKEAYLLDQSVDHFDAGFFSMSQAEVERLDPQQRMLLEVVYEALENAGETDPPGRNVAVYTGSFGEDWAHMQSKDLQDGGVYNFTGHDDFVHANRVSYEFNLSGPSMTIKVGCSSGLVALHLACEALQRGDCTGAIVCAANLLLSTENFLKLDTMGVLSRDGSSKSFDADANGYARGEAVDAVYIKRLDDAIRDGNPIRAVIRGTAVNADGKTRGLFTPSPDAHAALIRRAYEKAGISNPNETPLVECHGTGTATGDPLELSAVAKVLSGKGGKGIYVGSVKPNIGHGESAAGLSSLIKAVLALERKVIPPNIKFHTPNPKIPVPFSESNITVPTEPIPWPSDRVQRVSINSFGMGGANAHVIVDAAPSAVKQNGVHTSKQNGSHTLEQNGNHTLEQNGNHTSSNGTHTSSNGTDPPSNGIYTSSNCTTSSNGTHTSGNGTVVTKETQPTEDEKRLLVFSAHNEASLQKMISNYKEFVEHESFNLADLAYTLSGKRHHWNVRSFCVSNGKTIEAASASKVPKFKGLLFIFTGQGAQWAGMGRQLLRDFSTFKEDIQQMDLWLAETSHPPSWKMEEVLRYSRDLNSAELSQPIGTALQIALVNLLRQWGILPSGVVGHSSGEIAAAYAAGAIGMKEALLISYYRGYASSQLRRPGSMGAIGLGRQDLEGLLVGNVVIACENSRSSVTISGDSSDVEASLERVSQMRPGVLARKLKVDHAYHSSFMEESAKFYEGSISSIKTAQGKLSIPFFSSVTGHRTYDAASLGPAYWRLNMENPVLFLSAVESALHGGEEYNIALEIGPHSTLSGPFRQICKDIEQKMQYISVLTRGADSTHTILTALGQLFCQGVMPSFDKLNPPGLTLSTLPPYPWNHGTSYWHESRISREFRAREYPEHEVLGARIIGGNDLEPSWRKLLDLNNTSWLNDHVLAGDIVFPGAGYIVIIGEAIRQLSKSSSFTIRHMSIDAVMMIQSGQPTEVITKLQPHGIRTKLQSSSWYDFTVSSYDGNKWNTHCSGSVRGGETSNQSMFPSNVETIRQVQSSEWYRISKAAGIEYGPAFQALRNIQSAAKLPVTIAEISDDQLPKVPSYAVHPIAIDQMLQCCIIGSFQGHIRNMNMLAMPVHIGELRVTSQEGHSDLQLQSEITSRNAGTLLANGQIQVKDGPVILQCDDIQFRTMKNVATEEAANDALHKVQMLEWKPDIDLTDAEQLIHRKSDLTSCIKLIEKLHILCEIETALVLKNLEPSKPHMARAREWVEEFVANIQSNGSTVVDDTKYMFEITSEERQTQIRTLLEEALETPAKDVAIAVTRMYYAAADMFCGRMEVLGVLMADNILTSFYNFLNMVNYDQFLQLLGHSNPGMRILEIGAGTGGFTSTVLPALHKPGFGYMYGTYTYTDISSGFFKSAKERFEEYPNIEYVKLDVTQDLATQGLQLNSYDLVIAANVLHATPDLHQTLSNCRSLLRPGGRLLLLELCAEAKFINYVMAFLPGWWLGESDGRMNEPYLQPAQWDTALRKAGFSGVEASIVDQAPPYHLDAVTISRASQPEAPPCKNLTLLLSDPSAVNEHIRIAQSNFESDGYRVSLCSLEDLPSISTDVISFLEVDSSGTFFQDISETRFKSFIYLIEQCSRHGSRVLWVTGPAQISTENPHHAMILGLARTLRLELGSLFATLELDTTDLGLSQYNAITQVFRKLQTQTYLSYSTMDCEYALANGLVCIPRYITSSVESLRLRNMESLQVARRLFIKNPGLLNSLQWGLQSRGEELLDSEVEVEVRSASLNSWDFDVAQGTTQRNSNLGLECAGVISRVGTNAKHDFQPGGRVLCWSPGSAATHVQVDMRYCMKLPDGLTFDEAVTLSTSHAAMLRGLKELCNLAHGESVLIHSAAGADGIAAIQIARLIGAEIFVTVATDEQNELLEASYGIPMSHIFSSNDDSFVREVLQATNSRGVDVVVNISSGDLFYESWKCIAIGGSMLDLSQRDSTSHEKLDRSLLGGNRSFYTFDAVSLLQQKPSTARRLLQTVLDLYKDGSIQPISPIAKFAPSQAKEAFLNVAKRTGATCIDFPQAPASVTADFCAEDARFRADRSYLLVGGLGGLGRSAAMWLAERGAGCVIFLSRSASDHAASYASLLSELDALGCEVEIVAGSIAEVATVESIIKNAKKPIAGVMHLPVVVRDGMLLEMTHLDWTTAMAPKVQGVWSLHHAFQNHPLDFFIILGSVNGVRGNVGQGNYAAANTFLDAFVRYRQQLDLPACIIDLGAMADIGYASSLPKLLEEYKRAGAVMLYENDYHNSLEVAVRSCRVPIEPSPTLTSGFVNRALFIVGGIRQPLDSRAQGLACIYSGSQKASATARQTSAPGNDSNQMQRFMENARENPQSLEDDAAAAESFLAKQIFKNVKSLLIVDDDDTDVNESSSMSDLAVDSLMAMELQSWWRQSMGTQISVLELTHSASALELGKLARARIAAALKS